jgi:hypothetical protein
MVILNSNKTDGGTAASRSAEGQDGIAKRPAGPRALHRRPIIAMHPFSKCHFPFFNYHCEMVAVGTGGTPVLLAELWKMENDKWKMENDGVMP